jgi:hypothetical protein
MSRTLLHKQHGEQQGKCDVFPSHTHFFAMVVMHGQLLFALFRLLGVDEAGTATLAAR